MKSTYLIIAILLGGLAYLYFTKDSGHDQERKRLIEKHEHAMDSSHNVSEKWRMLAKEYGDQFRKEATRAMKAEQNMNYLREQNEILKKRPVIRYAVPQLDSALSARYPN